MQDVGRTILSQFGNSPTLLALIDAVNQWLDPMKTIDDWYENVWDVSTAQGYGLDVWGRIVGVQRVLQVASTLYWGYAEATTLSARTYGDGIFYSGQPTTSNYALSDEAFRLLIMAKAAANITDGSIPSINAILMALFPDRGDAWIADGLDMTMTYTFNFDPPLTQVEQAIVQQSGVLPRSTGVRVNVVQYPPTRLISDGGVLGLFDPLDPFYPTDPTGLPAGAVWSNAGLIAVVPGIVPNPAAPKVYFNYISASQLLALGGGNLPLTPPPAGSGQLWNNGGEIAIA